MTTDEKLYRQAGIIAGLEIAISSVERTGSLAELQTLLETEKAAYRMIKVKNGYDPTATLR